MTDSQLDFHISRASLPAQVAERIQRLVESDALKTGDKLPAERDLAERLGVSRPVIREALQMLSERGLVKIKPGCGTYVQEPSATDAAEYLELYFKLRHCPGSLRDFFEMRELLEVATAGLAAERATEADLRTLEKSLRAMRGHDGSMHDYVSADLAFHLALAQAAHNDYLLMLLSPLANIWAEVISLSTQTPDAIQTGIAFHEELYTLILQRDAVGAREAMHRHMLAALALSEAAQSDTVIPATGSEL